MGKKITVHIHFHGPPDSGNGGYSCGLIDAQTDYVSEITLRKPIPLDRALDLREENGAHKMWDGEHLIATAKPGDCSDLEVPDSVSFEQALEASKGYLGFTQGTAFSTCFVCGEDRSTGEGLHVFAGRVADSHLYASPWVPAADLAGESGMVQPQFIWAALDCPGAYAALGDTPRPVLLGRMTAELILPIKTGEKCVLTAWLIQQEGRKSWSGTAIFNEKGELAGKAKAIWFEV
ncbi:MAG: hypothetical protein AAFP08_16025 [Bacteroidota bacterium]